MDPDMEKVNKIFLERFQAGSKSTGYMDIRIEGDRLTLGNSIEEKNLLNFLSEEYGIEYGDPELVLCG